MVAYGMLAGKSVVMGLLVGLGRPLMKVFCLTFLACWGILLGLVGLCWVDPLSFGTTLSPFARRKPTWRLPLGGMVSGIIAGFGGSGPVSGAREGLGSVGGVFVGKGLKRVRLTKKTPCPEIYRASSRPIPDAGRHDPEGVGFPGPGRVVSRRVHGGSSPGSRLDREGIG